MKKILGFVGLLCFIFAAEWFSMLDGSGWVKMLGVSASVGAANVLGYLEASL